MKHSLGLSSLGCHSLSFTFFITKLKVLNYVVVVKQDVYEKALFNS